MERLARRAASLPMVQRARVHIEARIAQLGHKLPVIPPEPKGNYCNFIQTGRILHMCGHLPQPAGGLLMTGRLGENMTTEQGQLAARLCGLQMLASVKAACGDLDRVKKVIKLVGFVNSINTYTSQAQVMNGCSDLMGEVFGEEIGRHARSSIGTSVLPLGVPVEIEGIFELKD